MTAVRTILLLSLVTTSLSFAAAPTTRHAYNPKPAAAVDAAIRALSREWTAAQAGGKAKLRTTCNYFKENHSDDVTPQTILSALERGSGDSKIGRASCRERV